MDDCKPSEPSCLLPKNAFRQVAYELDMTPAAVTRQLLHLTISVLRWLCARPRKVSLRTNGTVSRRRFSPPAKHSKMREDVPIDEFLFRCGQAGAASKGKHRGQETTAG
jgi:hypothetical protein